MYSSMNVVEMATKIVGFVQFSFALIIAPLLVIFSGLDYISFSDLSKSLKFHTAAVDSSSTSPERPSLVRTSLPVFSVSSKIQVAHSGYAVQTESCSIPDYDPYNADIARLLRNPTPDYVTCDVTRPVLTFVDRETIRINRTAFRLENAEYCDYQAIVRRGDNSVSYRTAVRFSTDVKPAVDFVRVRCFGARKSRLYSNFHAIVRHVTGSRSSSSPVAAAADELPNVLIVGVDSTSRLNSVRGLNGTRRLLSEISQVVELKGYSRVGDNTYPNIMALLTGQFANERPAGPVDGAHLLWRPFQAVGYRTLYAEDSYVGNHIFNIWLADGNTPGGFVRQPTDFYLRPLSVAMRKDRRGEAVAVRRLDGCCRFCVGPDYETQFILNWIHDFVAAHNNHTDNNNNDNNSNGNSRMRPFFAFSFFSSITHDDLNEVTHLDAFLQRFFERLSTSGLLRRTVVVLVSDHGLRFGASRSYSRMSWYEENLPMALFAFPESFRRQHPAMLETLRVNSGRLTTPFDVGETLRRLSHIDRPYNDTASRAAGRRGVSLLDVELGNRTCQQAHITPTYCECLLSNTHEIPVNSSEVQRSAVSVLQYMNSKLSSRHGELCSRLELAEIIDARSTDNSTPTQQLLASDRLYVTLTFRTTPGNGTFQAVVMELQRGGRIDVAGDILRINEHGSQSKCIDQLPLQKWCHCVDTNQLSLHANQP